MTSPGVPDRLPVVTPFEPVAAVDDRDAGSADLGRSGLESAERRWGLVLSIPAIIFFLAFWVYPFVSAVYYSFTDYDFTGSPEWVGFENYRFMFEDTAFHNSVRVTLLFAFGTIVPTIVLGFLLALPLARPGRASTVLRSMFFIPAIMPLVAAAFLWQGIFAPDGLANQLLGKVGIDSIGWINDPDWALRSLIIMVIWKSLGLYMLLVIAGLNALPADVYEAAALDGSRAIRTFFQITLPLMRRTLLFVVVIATVASMQSFVPAYLLTRGGPAGATELLPMYLYANAFSFTDVGLASSVSVLLFVVLLVLSFVQFRVFRVRDRA